jgi:hypothetical protein
VPRPSTSVDESGSRTVMSGAHLMIVIHISQHKIMIGLNYHAYVIHSPYQKVVGILCACYRGGRTYIKGNYGRE